MANTQDYGKQVVSFDYREEARSALFNRIFHDLLPYGIYSGGKLKRTSDTTIVVEPLSVIIDSNKQDPVASKIDTTEDQVIALGASGTCDTNLNYIILRFGWEDVEDNFMEIIRINRNSIKPTDIILGQVLFQQSGGKNIVDPANPFDYAERQEVSFKHFENLRDILAVKPTTPASKQVSITGGKITTSEGFFTINSTTFPSSPIAFPTLSKRIDLIVIDTNGELVYLKGAESPTPKPPEYYNYKVLAELHLDKNKTVITGNDIKRVLEPFTVQGMISPEKTPIVDPDNHFPDELGFITAALHHLWRNSYILNHWGTEIEPFRIDPERDLNYPLGDLFLT